MNSKWQRRVMILDDMHLYKNPIEAIIKNVIWTLSYLGVILPLDSETVVNAIGSAYFIFALSLLMEFTQKGSKKELIAKIGYLIFMFVNICMLISGWLLLNGKSFSGYPNNIAKYSAFMILGTMWIDYIVLYITTKDIEKNNQMINSEELDVKINERIDVFLAKGRVQETVQTR